MRYAFIIALLLLAINSMAQQQNVSGQVRDLEGNPIPNVSVREVDRESRVLNHTKADANGMFSFTVRDAQHWIQFSAPDYVTLTHKMLGNRTIKATMELKGKMDTRKAKILIKSKKLICGMADGRNIPQNAWIEQIQDTVFSLILPISVSSVIDEYPAGRTLTLISTANSAVMELKNVVDAYPVKGDPDEMTDRRLTQSGNGVDNGPYEDTDDKNLFCYPHFRITSSQIEYIISHLDQILSINVDTYKADNFWNLYLMSGADGILRNAMKKAAK